MSRHGFRNALIGAALVLATLIVYQPVTGHEFVNFDDDRYVTENLQVQQGLTADSIRWCATATVSANWHPLTLASHMLDVELYRLEAGKHHRTSVLLHVACTLLLFLVLWLLTRAPWPSAFVAALFALHPLHVESVAWVAERKDVLSALFWILTIGAYAWYVQRPGIGRYAVTIAMLGLGLMAKPMLVTLPFVLLLLDYWPLERWRPGKPGLGRLVLEKVPMLVLAATSSIVTYSVQQGSGAVRSTSIFPLSARIANAIVSYVAYLGKTIWPVDLAVLYPHPLAIPGWKVAGAALMLVAVSWLAIRSRQRHPYFVVGWLWYLGTLVPVIGLVQVGIQGMADRYSYIPLIGIYIVLAWGVKELADRWNNRRAKTTLAVAGAAIVIVLAVTARAQVRTWADSVTMWEQALGATVDNYTAHNNLGLALAKQGRHDEATQHYREAVRINPGYARAHNNLGSALRRAGSLDEAIHHLSESLRLDPDNAKAHNNLANSFATRGELDRAIEHYSNAVRLAPDYALAHYNLAISLKQQGRVEEAIRHYREALRANPRLARAHNNLGVLLRNRGQFDEAIDHFSAALQIDPNYQKARDNLSKARALKP